MKPAVPRAVVVNGVTYRVAVRPREKFGKDDDGACCQEQSLILIARELSPAQARSTYFHEVGHAAFFESGMGEILKDFTPQPDRLEELLLQVFAPVYRAALGVR